MIEIAVMAILKKVTIYLCLVVFAFLIMLIHSLYISDYQSSYKKQEISDSSFSRSWLNFNSVSRKVIIDSTFKM